MVCGGERQPRSLRTKVTCPGVPMRGSKASLVSVSLGAVEKKQSPDQKLCSDTKERVTKVFFQAGPRSFQVVHTESRLGN